MLEAEKLQLQEAVKKKITVSPVEVDKRLNGMIQDYHFTIEQLRQNLNNAGASEDALRSQITASIAWQKAVQDEYGDQVNITPDMVTAELQRYAEGANKPHYHVLEIFLPVDNPEQNAKVKKDAEEVEHQLHQGAPFPVVARQFSQHPTAATGGDMGWVNDGPAGARTEHGACQDGGGRDHRPHPLHRRLLHSGPARAPGADGHQDRRRCRRARPVRPALCRWRACCSPPIRARPRPSSSRS